MAGRKSLKEEIKIIERMSVLAVPTFKFIQKMYDSKEKADNRWAAEQMMKLYGKAVPTETDVTSGGLPIPITPLPNVQSNNSDSEGPTDDQKNQSGTGGNISVQDDINPDSSDITESARQNS